MREQVAMWKERGYTNMGVITQDQLKEIDTIGTDPDYNRNDDSVQNEEQRMSGDVN